MPKVAWSALSPRSGPSLRHAFEERGGDHGIAAALEADCLQPSVPIIFLMMIRRFTSTVSAFPDREDPTRWYFKFGKTTVLELGADGNRAWKSESSVLRRDVDFIIECARKRHQQQIVRREADRT